MPTIFYTLLHIQHGRKGSANLRTKTGREKLLLYLLNAKALSATLRQAGQKLVVLTNIKSALESDTDLAAVLDGIKLEHFEFTRDIPPDLPFFSAHFKLDLYEHFGTLDETCYSILCDLDMLALTDVPAQLEDFIARGQPLGYDISNQVIPAYGEAVISRDLGRITRKEVPAEWWGGEFVGGRASFFAQLAEECNMLYPNYLQHAPDGLHHIGDEAVTNAALASLRLKGELSLCDCGELGLIRRHWSIPTRHPQLPLKRESLPFLLHLPADKLFLAELGRDGRLCRDSLPERFQKYQLTPRQLTRRAYIWAKSLTSH